MDYYPINFKLSHCSLWIRGFHSGTSRGTMLIKYMYIYNIVFVKKNNKTKNCIVDEICVFGDWQILRKFNSLGKNQRNSQLSGLLLNAGV